MSFDVGLPGRWILYLNFRQEGSAPDGPHFAKTEQNFNFANLLEDSSKYLVSVERFRVPVTAIPMLPTIINAIQLVPKAAQPAINFTLQPTFSLNDFLVQVNEIVGELIIGLTEDGRIELSFTNFANYTIALNQKIADIFAMDTILDGGVGLQTFVGAAPLYDRFDDLHKIEIECSTGLSGIMQEIVTTNIFANLLTDFLAPSSFSMSYNASRGDRHNPAYTLTYPVRQDIEFNTSANRRFINLKGNAPVQNIALEIFAIFRDGTRNRILLPPNSVLEIKLAFWKK